MSERHLTPDDYEAAEIYENFLYILDSKAVDTDSFHEGLGYLVSHLSALVTNEEFQKACDSALATLEDTQFKDIVGLNKFEGIEIENDDN